MKNLTILSALILPLLAAGSANATQSIPWHWDDEPEHTVARQTTSATEEQEQGTFVSDIGW